MANYGTLFDEATAPQNFPVLISEIPEEQAVELLDQAKTRLRG